MVRQAIAECRKRVATLQNPENLAKLIKAARYAHLRRETALRRGLGPQVSVVVARVSLPAGMTRAGPGPPWAYPRGSWW